MLRPGLTNALIGGGAGTGVMTLGMTYAAPMMVGMEMDMAGMLSSGLGTGYGFGLALHFTLGVIIFPLLYVYIVYDRLRGPPIVRGLIWGLALWLAADLVVMPLLGAGFLMSNVGGWAAVLASLAAHMIWGLQRRVDDSTTLWQKGRMGKASIQIALQFVIGNMASVFLGCESVKGWLV